MPPEPKSAYEALVNEIADSISGNFADIQAFKRDKRKRRTVGRRAENIVNSLARAQNNRISGSELVEAMRARK